MKKNGHKIEVWYQMKHDDLQACLPDVIKEDQWVSVVPKDEILTIAVALHQMGFDCLLDLCVVDYLTYGEDEWDTEASVKGFGRARGIEKQSSWKGSRFVVVCHLLSFSSGERLRIKVPVDDECMPSLSGIWPSALWYEREAYDLFGVVFEAHPDLSRLLTDYGFEGHPFRKDFPLIGKVELRYDGESESCVYQPVSIEHRIGVPKVIRKDNRYHEN